MKPFGEIFKVLFLHLAIYVSVITASDREDHNFFRKPHRDKPVNIVLILADDLGYGDTSVFPFIGSGIQTPRLEKMAERGAILTNYHAAAATCTPTRASLLTGMNPWRLGIKAVFEYGEKGNSNRDDWLVQVPTAPMIFAEANYSTFHSGKWHLGGMRNDDLDMRLLPESGDPSSTKGSRRCHHPGPNQQGFQNYVSVLDGPGAPRQNMLQIDSKLYSHGCEFLLENDQKLATNKYNISGWLSYCEARHAMRAMSTAVEKNQPFYIHLWFHAPHGPWQYIPGYDHLYADAKRPKNIMQAVPCKGNTKNKQFCSTQGKQPKLIENTDSRFIQYRSMVSDMDNQIGMVLDHINSLGIEKDTLIVFTSDNGPEDDAGTAGSFRGNKRHIYEGGIRVPAIMQWVDTIPAGSMVNSMTVSTDIMATFLDAANIALPSNVHIDGMSILPEVMGAAKAPTLSLEMDANEKALAMKSYHSSNHVSKKGGHAGAYHRRKQQLQERVHLWMNDFEGPRRTVAIVYDYKVILDENEMPFEMYDLKHDPSEQHNLIADRNTQYWKSFIDQFEAVQAALPAVPITATTASVSASSKGKKSQSSMSGSDSKSITHLTKNLVHKQRQNPAVHHLIVERLYHTLFNYAKRGNEGYRLYLHQNQGLKYEASPLSDQRPMRTNIFRKGMTMDKANQIRQNLMVTGSCGDTACSCEVRTASQVKTLPFPGLVTLNEGSVQPGRAPHTKLVEALWWNPVAPQPFLNGSRILGLE
jgi:arylsulfatase A-like enzyme